MTKVRKKIGTIPINDIEQQVQQSTQAAVTQMQKDVSDFIDEETAQYPEIGGTFKYIEDPEGRTEILTDSEDKIISYRGADGVKHENVGIETENVVANTSTFETSTIKKVAISGGSASLETLTMSSEGLTDFQEALIANGFNPKSVVDWSDEKYVQLAIPRGLARINLIVDALPSERESSLKGTLEYWDMGGNYFKKPIKKLGIQGASSAFYAVKNFKFDTGDGSSWKFGHWVAQDSFHLKNFYIDVMVGENNILYNYFEALYRSLDCNPTRNAFDDSSISTTGGSGDFKKDFGTDAMGHPEGFPVELYVNGSYYALYALNLKKHRDNYLMDKNDYTSIHIDGHMEENTFWSGEDTIPWTTMEYKNPKTLLTNVATGYGYTKTDTVPSEYVDSPNNIKPTELSEEDIIAEWGSIANAPTYLKYVTNKGKVNYYMLGANFEEYDDENPKELLGSETPGYDPNNTLHVNTNTTKTVLKTLANKWRHVKDLVSEVSSLTGAEKIAKLQEAKSYMASFNDIENLILWEVINEVIWNADGSWGANTQWEIYRGVVMVPTFYDVDSCFGRSGHGNYIVYPGNEILEGYTPSILLRRLYAEEIKNFYAKLRTAGLISTHYIMSFFKDYMDKIGYDAYLKNLEKRNSEGNFIPSYRNEKINTVYWEKGTNVNAPTWDSSISYNIGDEVTYGYEDVFPYVCKSACINETPHFLYDGHPRDRGCYDGPKRIRTWLNNRIMELDTVYDYNQN